MLKEQHRLRSMILEHHKRNRKQKRRIQASSPITGIQATLQIWWSNRLKIINLRDTPNLRDTQNLQWIETCKHNVFKHMGTFYAREKQLSIVDRILMEESSCDKHSKIGSVNKAKKLHSNLVEVVYSHG